MIAFGRISKAKWGCARGSGKGGGRLGSARALVQVLGDPRGTGFRIFEHICEAFAKSAWGRVNLGFGFGGDVPCSWWSALDWSGSRLVLGAKCVALAVLRAVLNARRPTLFARCIAPHVRVEVVRVWCRRLSAPCRLFRVPGVWFSVLCARGPALVS